MRPGPALVERFAAETIIVAPSTPWEFDAPGQPYFRMFGDAMTAGTIGAEP